MVLYNLCKPKDDFKNLNSYFGFQKFCFSYSRKSRISLLSFRNFPDNNNTGVCEKLKMDAERKKKQRNGWSERNSSDNLVASKYISWRFILKQCKNISFIFMNLFIMKKKSENLQTISKKIKEKLNEDMIRRLGSLQVTCKCLHVSRLHEFKRLNI